jgi:hypothetical protein
MDSPPTRSELDALRAEYDQKLAAMQAELSTLRRRSGRHRQRRLIVLLPVVLLVALLPFSLLAANPFNDLNPGSVHNDNIDAIYNAGITTGCDPNVSYCPNDFVTREQMASFLARAAGLGTNPPVANAKTAQSATTAQNATNAVTAGIASKLSVTPVTGTTYAANEIVRTARAESQYKRDVNEFTVTKVANVDTTFDPIATLTLTASTGGFVIVTSTVGIGIEGASTAGFARLRDNTTPTNISPTLYTGTSSTAQSLTLSPVYVFPITAGARSFILEVQKSGPGTVHAFDGVISAVFVPFGSTGAGTLDGGQP